MTIWNPKTYLVMVLLVISSILTIVNITIFFKDQDISFLSGNFSQTLFEVPSSKNLPYTNTLSIPQTPDEVELSLTTNNGLMNIDSQKNTSEITLQTFANQEAETAITTNGTQTLLYSRSNPLSSPSNLTKTATFNTFSEQNLIINTMIFETEARIDLKTHTGFVDMFYHQTNSSTILYAPKELSKPFALEIDSYESSTKIFLPSDARIAIEGTSSNIYSEIPLLELRPGKISNKGTSKYLYTLRLNQDQKSIVEIFTYE